MVLRQAYNAWTLKGKNRRGRIINRCIACGCDLLFIYTYARSVTRRATRTFWITRTAQQQRVNEWTGVERDAFKIHHATDLSVTENCDLSAAPRCEGFEWEIDGKRSSETGARAPFDQQAGGARFSDARACAAREAMVFRTSGRGTGPACSRRRVRAQGRAAEKRKNAAPRDRRRSATRFERQRYARATISSKSRVGHPRCRGVDFGTIQVRSSVLFWPKSSVPRDRATTSTGNRGNHDRVPRPRLSGRVESERLRPLRVRRDDESVYDPTDGRTRCCDPLRRGKRCSGCTGISRRAKPPVDSQRYVVFGDGRRTGTGALRAIYSGPVFFGSCVFFFNLTCFGPVPVPKRKKKPSSLVRPPSVQ